MLLHNSETSIGVRPSFHCCAYLDGYVAAGLSFVMRVRDPFILIPFFILTLRRLLRRDFLRA